jgi:hypothetical protein
MTKVKYFFVVLSLVLVSNVFAQPKTVPVSPTRSYAATLKLSSLGIGLDATTNLAKDFNVRVGGQFYAFSVNGGKTGDDFIYTADTKLLSFSALVDYFPGGSIFKISGGLLINLNKVETNLVPGQSYVINGKTYDKSNLGDVTTTTEFTKVNPYLGIGIGNALAYKKFGFTMDLGTTYQFEPQVSMTGNGLIAPTARQSDIVQNNISWFKLYPVLMFGLTYKFN